jgi:hypothetical protein
MWLSKKRNKIPSQKRFSVWLVFELETHGWKNPTVCVLPQGRIPAGAAVWHYATYAFNVELAAAEYRYLESIGKKDRKYNPEVHGIPLGCGTSED